MASWLKAAGDLLEAVDRTANKVSTSREDQLRARQDGGPAPFAPDPRSGRSLFPSAQFQAGLSKDTGAARPAQQVRAADALNRRHSVDQPPSQVQTAAGASHVFSNAAAEQAEASNRVPVAPRSAPFPALLPPRAASTRPLAAPAAQPTAPAFRTLVPPPPATEAVAPAQPVEPAAVLAHQRTASSSGGIPFRLTPPGASPAEAVQQPKRPQLQPQGQHPDSLPEATEPQGANGDSLMPEPAPSEQTASWDFMYGGEGSPTAATVVPEPAGADAGAPAEPHDPDGNGTSEPTPLPQPPADVPPAAADVMPSSEPVPEPASPHSPAAAVPRPPVPSSTSEPASSTAAAPAAQPPLPAALPASLPEAHGDATIIANGAASTPAVQPDPEPQPMPPQPAPPASLASAGSLDRADTNSGGRVSSRKPEGAAPIDAATLRRAASDAGREEQLSKTVALLRSRLDARQAEIQQLEELLQAADDRASGAGGAAARLEDELARAQAAKISAEAALSRGMAAAEDEAQELRQQLLAALQKARDAEKRTIALEASRDSSLVERQEAESRLVGSLRQVAGLETRLEDERRDCLVNPSVPVPSQEAEARLVDGLREEVVAAEVRLEDERRAHAAARQAATQRETELQASLAEAAASLAGLQRGADDRAARAAAAEERASAAEAENDALGRDLAAARERLRRQEENASQAGLDAARAEAESWKQESARAKQAAAGAEARAAGVDAQLAALQAEADTLRIAAAGGAASADLERRYKEVTELLYLKQTQLEQMAGEKAAQALQLERELAAARASAERARRREVVDRAASSGFAAFTDDVVPMESLGGAYSRLASHARLGSAIKSGARYIDSSASMAVRVLRQYPVSRLLVFAYLLGVHLFIYALLNRLQRRALSEAALLPQS